MNTMKPIEVVREVYANFAAGKIPAVLELLSPTVSWTIHGPEGYPFFGNFQGREGFQTFLSGLNEAAEILQFESGCFFEADPRVIVTGSEKARARRSRLSYQTTWCHIFTVLDDQVVAFEEYVDSAPIVAAYDGNQS